MPRRSRVLICLLAIVLPACEEKAKPDARAELERRKPSIMSRMDRIAADAAREKSQAGSSVVLDAAGPDPEAVARALRAAQSAPPGLADPAGASRLQPGQVLASGLSPRQARELADALVAAGATAHVEPADPASEESVSPAAADPPDPREPVAPPAPPASAPG